MEPRARPKSWSRRRRWSSTRARIATRSASSTTIAARSPTPRSLSTSPRRRRRRRSKGPPGKRKSSAKGRSRGPGTKPSKRRRSAHSRPRSKRSKPSPPSGPRRRPTTESAATVVYSTNLDFPSNGEWRIAAVIKEEDGEFTGAILPSAVVGEFDGIPRVGDQAPVIHTPTAADAGGDLSKVTTRIPPDTQNRVDFADVAGEGTDCPLVCDPSVLPESGMRPRRRRRRAGQGDVRATRSTSSTWRSTTTTIQTRASGPRCAPTTCRASRGCS